MPNSSCLPYLSVRPAARSPTVKLNSHYFENNRHIYVRSNNSSPKWGGGGRKKKVKELIKLNVEAEYVFSWTAIK